MTDHKDLKSYNAGAMLLHWAIALCIFVQLAGGLAITRLDFIPDDMRFGAYQWHKTIGFLVLTLTIIRIVWRLFHTPPAHAPMSRMEAKAAGLVQYLFYALMLLVPLTGWLVVSVSPTAIPTLLMMSHELAWPNLPVPLAWHGIEAEAVAKCFHTWLAYSTAALVVLHIAGALKHSIIDRMPSFSRMLPTRRLPRQSMSLFAVPISVVFAGLFLTFGLLVGRMESTQSIVPPSPTLTAGSSAGEWAVDTALSKITFAASFSGKTVNGVVSRWKAAIVFNPEALATSSAEISIDPTSISVDDTYVGANLLDTDGFNVAAFSVVKVHIDRFEKQSDGYIGHGTISVKDKSAPFVMPFSFTPEANDGARAIGTVSLDRLILGLGVQNDGGAQSLGKNVTVRFDLTAKRPKPPVV
jgi:cytochrome b561/polyisoprenoid-binding protein YceI